MSIRLSRIFLMIVGLVVGVMLTYGAKVAAGAETAGIQVVNMLGSQSIDGINLSASLQETATMEAATGQSHSHRLQVKLVDEKTGKAVTGGRVTVSVVDPDRETTIVPIPLQAVEDHYEAAVDLNEPGRYEVRVLVVLAKDPPRQYAFDYDYQ